MIGWMLGKEPGSAKPSHPLLLGSDSPRRGDSQVSSAQTKMAQIPEGLVHLGVLRVQSCFVLKK